MSKITIELSKNEITELKNDFNIGICSFTQSVIENDLEEDVDEAVKKLLKTYFEECCVKNKKTGNKNIDDKIPSYHGDSGCGRPDVMIYNYFNKNEIDVIIEDKKWSSQEAPIPQATCYANIGNIINHPVRVIIGYNPSKDLEVEVLVNGQYKPLIINGSVIRSFIGPKTLEMIYDNPDINEFVIIEQKNKNFTSKDFQTILTNLRNKYRQTIEIGNHDDVSINFTVAFVALKMIIEKNGKKWDIVCGYDDIEKAVKEIIGEKCNKELNEKYADIFIIKDADGKKEMFNFLNTITAISVREYNENIQDKDSLFTSIINELNKIPQGELSIDLFGEVYEALASKKTKSALGEFFTRRHIIKAIVGMFLTDNDVMDIVEHKSKIADIACGTGGFLTESFKHIKNYCTKYHPNLNISNLAKEVIVGYDINPSSIGRTRINMTLAGDGFSDIRTKNTLTLKDYSKGIKYILTNVPYGTKGNDIVNYPNSSDEFLKSNNSKRLELNFVIKAVEMLEKGGKAAIIVPEGLLEAPSLASFREWLLKYCKLTTIISLPKFAFAPYTKWKTYVIFIEKRNTPLENIEEIKPNEKTWCYIVDNDGFANSDKRFPTKLRNADNSWKHDELSPYTDTNGIYHKSLIEQRYDCEADDTDKLYVNEWSEDIIGKKYGFINIEDIKKKQIVQFEKMDIKSVQARIKTEAFKRCLLNEETHNLLLSLLTKNKKGEYKVSKDDYLINNDGNIEIKEEFVPIFEQLNIKYDLEENKYYDISKENIIYALPLIPEKYFRTKEIEWISLYDLKNKVNEIKNQVKELLGI